jgi:hypothetical protein
MSGMSKVVNRLFKEMNAWSRKHTLESKGAPFLRFFVIDVEGDMDIEVGIPVETPLKDDGWVTASVLPARTHRGGWMRVIPACEEGSGMA